jgi:NDP-sugar pyrophosphorylase family protein
LPNSKRERFSVVETKNGFITAFGGMPGAVPVEQTPLMFTGIQILEKEIFAYIPRGVFSHSVIDVYPQAIAKGERIAAHVASGKWRELSTLQRYLDISLEMLQERGEKLYTGRETVVSKGAFVEQAILWDRVQVSAGARISRAVLADGVSVAKGDVIENAVVVVRSLVEGKEPPEKAMRGRVQGSNFVVPLAE